MRRRLSNASSNGPESTFSAFLWAVLSPVANPNPVGPDSGGHQAERKEAGDGAVNNGESVPVASKNEGDVQRDERPKWSYRSLHIRSIAPRLTTARQPPH